MHGVITKSIVLIRKIGSAFETQVAKIIRFGPRSEIAVIEKPAVGGAMS